MDKKAELELKKAKLEQMRKKKAAQAQAAMASDAAAYSNTSMSSMEMVDAEKILIEVGITTPVLLSNMSSSSLTNSASSLTIDGESPMQHHFVPGAHTKSIVKNKKPYKLTSNIVNKIDIPPRENVTYSKETQTPATDIILDKDAKPLDYYVLTYDNNDEDDTVSLDAVSTSTPGAGTASSSTQSGARSTPRHTHQTGHGQQQQHAGGPADSSAQSLKGGDAGSQTADDLRYIEDKVKLLQLKEINEEERLRLLESDDFLNFFMRNTRILEKALDQDDIFFEYGASEKNNELVETGQAFKLNKEFYDDRWRNRIVTWLDWSPHYPELLLASYEDSSLDPDGVALVWNTKFKSSSPEFIFNCSSWVTSCCFAKFHPNLILGGTYSGQIVMWDNRSNKRTPIQRSSLSAASHTHPIHCVQVVGSQNAHNLISISNDGKLCSWTLDNMNTPQETLELQCKATKQVAVTCMGFRPGDVNNFVIGSEEGPLFMATRHGNKSGINESFDGHYGPVTGLSCHQVPGPIDFSHIFLTSSFDWSVKLWNLKEPGKPLYSFENNSDYVYDVQWSPINPALFACVDGTGKLDLWNLINDAEVPTASLLIDGAPALNKVRWSSCGHQLVVGDDQGKISLFDVNESYSSARQDDWTKFVRVLHDLKQNSSEMDQAAAAAGGVAGGSMNAAGIVGAGSSPASLSGGGGSGGGGSGGGGASAGSNMQPQGVGLTSSSGSSVSSFLPSRMSPNLQSVKSEPNFDLSPINKYTSPTYMQQIKMQPQTPR